MCIFMMRQYGCGHFIWFIDERCERKGYRCPFVISGRDDMYEMACSRCRNKPATTKEGDLIVRPIPVWVPSPELIRRFYDPNYLRYYY